MESWREGPAGNYQDSIKAGYLTADAKGVDSRLEAASEAYDEQQQMDQINKLLQEEQVCIVFGVCVSRVCVPVKSRCICALCPHEAYPDRSICLCTSIARLTH